MTCHRTGVTAERSSGGSREPVGAAGSFAAERTSRRFGPVALLSTRVADFSEPRGDAAAACDGCRRGFQRAALGSGSVTCARQDGRLRRVQAWCDTLALVHKDGQAVIRKRNPKNPLYLSLLALIGRSHLRAPSGTSLSPLPGFLHEGHSWFEPLATNAFVMKAHPSE